MTLSLTCHSCGKVLSAETEDELVVLGQGHAGEHGPPSRHLVITSWLEFNATTLSSSSPLVQIDSPSVKATFIRSPRRSRSLRAVAALSLGVCLAGLLAACSNAPAQDAAAGRTSKAAAAPVELDGRSLPPWPAPTDVAARVTSAGLDLGPMGMAEHYHPHLQIIVKGSEVPVPANIGVDPATGAMSALHTHEPDGTIHIEADRAGEVFTLGQLFIQWGVKLSATQIGGVQAKDGQQVMLTSNGAPVAGDPTQLRLQPEQKIVLQLP